jgi:hemoglobin-like flavoprotein
MTPEQMQIVRLSLARATTDRHALGREFYRRLFVIAPDLRMRFHGNIDTESAKLKEALTLAFASLSDMPFLVATLEALAARGVARDMAEQHCRAIAQALLWAIERQHRSGVDAAGLQRLDRVPCRCGQHPARPRDRLAELARGLIHHHAADTCPRVHQVETPVDVR